MRKKCISIGLVIFLIAVMAEVTAFEYREGDIVYATGGLPTNHVGMLVMDPATGELAVHEAQIASGILLTPIAEFMARPYSGVYIMHVDGVSDEDAARAADNVMERYPPKAGTVNYASCAAVVEFAYDSIGVPIKNKQVDAFGVPVPSITVPDDIYTGYDSQNEVFNFNDMPAPSTEPPAQDPGNHWYPEQPPDINMPDPTIDPSNPPADPNAPAPYVPDVHTDPIAPFPSDPDAIPEIPDINISPFK